MIPSCHKTTTGIQNSLYKTIDYWKEAAKQTKRDAKWPEIDTRQTQKGKTTIIFPKIPHQQMQNDNQEAQNNWKDK